MNHITASCGTCTQCRAFVHWKLPHGTPHEYTLAQREYREGIKRPSRQAVEARIAVLEAELSALKGVK